MTRRKIAWLTGSRGTRIYAYNPSMGEVGSAILWVLKYACGGIVSFATPRLLTASGVPLERWVMTVGALARVRVNKEIALWAATVLLAAILYVASAAISGGWDPQVPEIFIRAWNMVRPVYVILLGIGIALAGAIWQVMRGPEATTRVLATGTPTITPVKPAIAPATEIVAAKRPLSAYEAERKAKVLDNILIILRVDMQPLEDKWYLPQVGHAWNSLKDPKNNSGYTPGFGQVSRSFQRTI